MHSVANALPPTLLLLLLILFLPLTRIMIVTVIVTKEEDTGMSFTHSKNIYSLF